MKEQLKQVQIIRKYKKKDYTIGLLYIDGQFFCNTIEDTDRGLKQDMQIDQIKKIKQYGVTAIPTGTYEVEITYSPKFKKNLPLIKNVKGFEGIRIHSGNTAKDSLGCILLGKNDKVGYVSNSRYYTQQFIDSISNSKVILTIC